VANELLEQHEELRTIIMDRLKIIAVTALKQEEVEVVQRLLEVTLRYEMRQDYAHILSELFDLKCKFFIVMQLLVKVMCWKNVYIVVSSHLFLFLLTVFCNGLLVGTHVCCKLILCQLYPNVQHSKSSSSYEPYSVPSASHLSRQVSSKFTLIHLLGFLSVCFLF
jgi:hypothetical protein